jgi:hypothetical protein
VANLPPVSLIPVAGIIDTGGKFATTLAKLVEKFATGVVDNNGAP